MGDGSVRFHLAPDVAAKGVTGAFSLLLGVDQRGADIAAVAAFVDSIVDGVRSRATRDAITADPVYAGFHDLHRAFAVPTRKLFAASENLIRFVEKRGDLPRILPLVDVYNAVSLETRLALGAHDVRAIEGNVSLRLTDGSERFHPVGAEGPEPIRPGEYAYVDDGGEVICRLEVRQVEKTKVTEDTRDLFLIVQGNAATPAEVVWAGHRRLVETLQRFFGGESEVLHRPS